MQDVGVAVEQNVKLILNLCRQQLLYDGHPDVSDLSPSSERGASSQEPIFMVGASWFFRALVLKAESVLCRTLDKLHSGLLLGNAGTLYQDLVSIIVL